MARVWLFSSLGLGLVAGVLFAVFPSWDLGVARLFFNADAGKFSHAFSQALNWIWGGLNALPWLFAIPPIVLLVLKLIFPAWRMPIAPSVVIYLVASFVIGPGLLANVSLKENWGRPRPNQVQQFGGSEHFQPWWRPSGECSRNCSFVSGEASQGFWLVAPASLAPPQWRPIAMAARSSMAPRWAACAWCLGATFSPTSCSGRFHHRYRHGALSLPNRSCKAQ